MSRSLASLLGERGTAANNGTFWINRPLEGGYEINGPGEARSFWSWDGLVRWANQEGVDLTSGWQKSEVDSGGNMQETSKLVLVDLWAPSVVDLTEADHRVKLQVGLELRAYIEAGATDAQIQREAIRRYRRIFYRPEMVATWRLVEGVEGQLAVLHRQGYHVTFFGEHLQRGYLAIERWCQQHCPHVPFSLALNDLPLYVEGENVFALGTRQKVYERAGWAFCLIMTLVRFCRAEQVVVITEREEVQEHYERAKERGDLLPGEVRFIGRLQDLAVSELPTLS